MGIIELVENAYFEAAEEQEVKQKAKQEAKMK